MICLPAVPVPTPILVKTEAGMTTGALYVPITEPTKDSCGEFVLQRIKTI